jgi:hypothetical protein
MLLRCAGVLVAWLAVTPLQAGEIQGLLPQLPPFHERDFEFVFSNDFLGRGGSVDDFRTQQLIFSSWSRPVAATCRPGNALDLSLSSLVSACRT